MGVLLAAYAAILAFGATGGSAAVYSFESNAVAIVDQLFLPGSKYFGTWDPLGILPTIPSLAITTAGLLAGRVLVASGPSSAYAPLYLLLVGFVSINVGIFADYVIPVNPYLWTFPFCAIAIGAGTTLLGAFHAALNVKRPCRWATGLMSLGRNSVFVVLVTLAFFSGLEWVVRFAWLLMHLELNAGNPVWAVIIFLAACGIAFLLDRRKLYITI
jgi:predicted acyltransferase